MSEHSSSGPASPRPTSPHPSRLPERPSLEQLQKHAKELLRAYRVGQTSALERFRSAGSQTETVALADAQFVLAREYGFPTWAGLKHYIEAVRSPEMEKFEALAHNLAAAYVAGDRSAIREINWHLGTSFIWDHEPERMQQRLPTWFTSASRASELALADARIMIARSYGCIDWATFATQVAAPSASMAASRSSSLFYQIDEAEGELQVRGLMSSKDWELVRSLMLERKLTRLSAGGVTDDALPWITQLDQVTHLQIDNSGGLTDKGALQLARMPQLEALALGGPRSLLTDRCLQILPHLPNLRKIQLCWMSGLTDAGVAQLKHCHSLEAVDLMGTPTGDAAIEALAGKAHLRHLKTGRNVTGASLSFLHQFPAFKTWQGGERRFDLMTFEARPNHLFLDGPFHDRDLEQLRGLDGLSALTFFWHCPHLTGEGLAPLRSLPNLHYLGCQGANCTDEAMAHIAAIPQLRMLMGQGTVATDRGFQSLSRSPSLEYFWGRECPNLTGKGFVALSAMAALRGLAVSCRNVGHSSLASLPDFPSLVDLMPMDVSDDGFRYVGQCSQLERLACMYCRDTGDVAASHLSGLQRLRSYYAGETCITDIGVEALSHIQSLEKLDFWACSAITDAGIAALARLPHLRELTLSSLPNVTREAAALFRRNVLVKYS